MRMVKDVIILIGILIKYVYVWLLLRFGYKNILKSDTWLISEKRTEARDNGYHMFKYMRIWRKEELTFYSIVKGSDDTSKINQFGNIVEYNSIMHIALYLASKYLLYCQIDSKPYENVHGIGRLDFLCRKDQIRVYLTHGICKDNVPSSYDYRLAGYDIFICGARPEYDYYKKIYNYPDKNIALTGLCRFDALEDESLENIILIMPTFRNWLRTSDSAKVKASDVECTMMMESEFYKKYSSLLQNEKLNELLENSNSKIVFYLHYTIQPYTHLFKSISSNDRITICDRGKYDVQDLLKKSKVLITDYSSVAFDFAYMKKPSVYYHFDYAKYRTDHYKEGFFKYNTHGVGPVIENEEELIIWLKNTIDNGYRLEKLYYDRLGSFFISYDNNNCKRVYETIKNY